MKLGYDEQIEDRITMEVVVDAYGAEERAIGWYCYLQDKISFPFRAQCRERAAKSPLKIEEVYQVIGLAGEEECDSEIYVMVDYGDDQLAVGLSQLVPLGEEVGFDQFEEGTLEAVKDWHYWVRQGYRF